MIKPKILPILLILVLAAACSQQAAPPQTGTPVADNEQNRMAAAKEYLKIDQPQELLQEMTAGVAGHLPQQFHKPFETVISSQALKDAVYQVALKALVKDFSTNEIKAMTAFYSTPEGRIILRKERAYKAEVFSGINTELMTAFKKVVDEQKAQASPGQMQPEPKMAPETKVPPQPKSPAPPAAPKPAPPAAK